ncbi:hypothetical protein GCM10010912_23140 [Paenibacillus albidus]|uniref:Replicative helicase inhibitor G39P N-terminal domain-containing protein n=1 Tax=Paenibacillus albidus TaxID=2041023 RepID=A0A917FFT7_9BACL|nr:hypothetical protein [Paenibacillus albidus]GGF77435.1 hypothetical protein GCM10010912_23140 [Paenibacillus albidus]
MRRAQVIDLLIKLKQEYSHQIDTSDQEVTRLYEHLKDFPFDVAVENVRKHIQTNSFPPKISQIRGKVGDLREIEQQKKETAEYLAQRDAERTDVALPPAGWKESLYARLGITRTTE